MSAPTNSSIEIYSGQFLDLLNPTPVMTLEDVAHGLGNCCRFAGQVRSFYSVAEHAVRVAERLWDQLYPSRVVLAGLHHDDSEAFIGDITRPLKRSIPNYKPIEARMTAVIQEALGLPGPGGISCEAIHEADDWALRLEAYALLPSGGAWLSERCDFRDRPVKPPEDADRYPIQLWPPEVAKEEFIVWHRFLVERVV